MSYPHAIFASAVVMAVAIATNQFAPTAGAGGSQAGTYALEKSDAGVWRINSETGHVSHCTFELNRKNELIVKCLPWAD